MKRSRLVGATALAVVLTACSSPSAQQPRPPSPTDVVATVGSTSITLAQVDEKALQQPTSNFGSLKLSQALYEARRGAVDDLIDDMLIQQEATTRKLDSAALIQQEVTAKVAPVSDQDVETWYRENQQRLQGAAIDQVRVPIRNYLVEERTTEARRTYVNQLRSKVAVHVHLEPPRQVIAKADRPTRGPASAPVEIIEFSDFQCPFCERAFPVVAQVLKTYGDKIRLVYRHYPLTMHPQARPAAEAAACAAEQGKFWEYHDRLFGDQTKLSDADLKEHAVALGMNAAQFNDCVDSRKYKALVDADIAAAEDAGVTGTPAFFINGRMLSGAQPFEEFKRIIDDELATAAQ